MHPNNTFSCSFLAAHPLQMLPSTVTHALGETALPLTLLVLSQSLPFLQTALPILSQHRPHGQSLGWIPSPPLGHDSGPHLHRVDLLPLGHWTPLIASLLAPRLSPLPIPQQIPLEVQRVVGRPQGSLKCCPHLLMPPGGLLLTCLHCLWRKYQHACGSLAYQRQLWPCSKGSELTAGSWCSWLRTSCHMISSWADSMSPRSHSSYRAGGPKFNAHYPGKCACWLLSLLECAFHCDPLVAEPHWLKRRLYWRKPRHPVVKL